jgi:hypothetical protein
MKSIPIRSRIVRSKGFLLVEDEPNPVIRPSSMLWEGLFHVEGGDTIGDE